MKNSVAQKIVASLVLLIAVGFLVGGSTRTHKVYEQNDDFSEFGMQTFERISDFQLVIDATFTGTMRKDDKLYSMYDRSKPRGKRACPT